MAEGDAGVKQDPMERIEEQYRSNISDVTVHYRWMGGLAAATVVLSVGVCLLIPNRIEFLEFFIAGWAVLVACVYSNIYVLNALLAVGAAMATPEELRSEEQERVLSQSGRMTWFAKAQQTMLFVGSMLVLGAAVGELLVRGV